MNHFTYIVTKEDVEEKFPVKTILRRRFDFSTRLRNKIKRNSTVLVNGEKAVFWSIPNVGDEIKVLLPEEKNSFIPENIPIDIVLEDNHLLILNKPPGIVAHPTKGQPCHTLSNGISYHQHKNAQDYKVRFINRIDMDTSGIIMIAKTSYAQDIITKEMKAHHVEKRYVALVFGVMKEKKGTINLPIGRPTEESVMRKVMDGGQESITHYSVIQEFGSKFSLLSLKLETGRTHQIRVHLSHLGHPIVGDYLYGGDYPTLMERQALHAEFISFTHPISKNRVELHAPLPKDISVAIDTLKKNYT